MSKRGRARLAGWAARPGSLRHRLEELGETADILREAARTGAIRALPRGGQTAIMLDPGLMRTPAYRAAAVRLGELFGRCESGMVELHVLSQALAEGLKVFCPTAEECFALEEVEMRLPVSAYAQPFPSFCVQFPPEYAQARAVRGIGHVPGLPGLGIDTDYRPVGMVLRHEASLSTIMGALATTDPLGTFLTIRLGKAPDNIIEDDVELRMNALAAYDEEYALLTRCTRVAVNACLLLMDRGFARRPSPGDEGRERAQAFLKRAGRPNGPTPPEAARVRQQLALMESCYGFSQRVDVRRAVGPAEAAGELGATGRTVRPHWRRAHWRMQRHGEGNALQKRLLIPHVMVNKGRFAGSPAATTAVYG